MREISRRVQKLESQARPKAVLTTAGELVDFVLKAQRGEVSIHDAEIGAQLLEGNMSLEIIDAKQALLNKLAAIAARAAAGEGEREPGV